MLVWPAYWVLKSVNSQYKLLSRAREAPSLPPDDGLLTRFACTVELLFDAGEIQNHSDARSHEFDANHGMHRLCPRHSRDCVHGSCMNEEQFYISTLR